MEARPTAVKQEKMGPAKFRAKQKIARLMRREQSFARR